LLCSVHALSISLQWRTNEGIEIVPENRPPGFGIAGQNAFGHEASYSRSYPEHLKSPSAKYSLPTLLLSKTSILLHIPTFHQGWYSHYKLV
jgi:hypothetical protein